MKRQIAMTLIILVFLSISCSLFGLDNNKIPKWYPSIRTYSNRDMIKFNSKYNRFIKYYHLNNIKTGIDSISAHLKYIQFNDDLQICDFTSTSDSIEIFKNKILDFYHYWWRLFSNERFVIDSSSISISKRSSVVGTFFIKTPYDPSINISKRESGYLKAGVDKNGRLYFIRSSLVPQLRIPDQPLISEDEAFDIIEGYKIAIDQPLFSHYETYTMTRENLSKPELSIYVQRTTQDKVECLEYRLVWRFKCRVALVYVDAITGEIIGHKVTILFM